jgi:hypothetical protein
MQLSHIHTVILFFSFSAKFGICAVVGLSGTRFEAKYKLGILECAYFSFNKCPIYTKNSANAT